MKLFNSRKKTDGRKFEKGQAVVFGKFVDGKKQTGVIVEKFSDFRGIEHVKIKCNQTNSTRTFSSKAITCYN